MNGGLFSASRGKPHQSTTNQPVKAHWDIQYLIDYIYYIQLYRFTIRIHHDYGPVIHGDTRIPFGSFWHLPQVPSFWRCLRIVPSSSTPNAQCRWVWPGAPGGENEVYLNKVIWKAMKEIPSGQRRFWINWYRLGESWHLRWVSLGLCQLFCLSYGRQLDPLEKHWTHWTHLVVLKRLNLLSWEVTYPIHPVFYKIIYWNLPIYPHCRQCLPHPHGSVLRCFLRWSLKVLQPRKEGPDWRMYGSHAVLSVRALGWWVVFFHWKRCSSAPILW